MSVGILAVRNIAARPTRALLLTVIVGLAIATAMTLIVLSGSIKDGVREGWDERGADLNVLQKDAPDILSGYVPQRLEQQLVAVKGISAVAGELVMFAPVDGSRHMVVMGWDSKAYSWRNIKLSQGAMPKDGDVRPVILGGGVAAALKKEPGSTIEIFGEKFRVAGVSSFASALNRASLFVRLTDLQDLAIRKGQVTGFNLSLDRSVTKQDIARITQEIEGFGRYSVTPTDRLLSNDRNYEVLYAVSRAISIIAFAMGVLSVASALLLAVHERRREIGVLMAIGWSDVRIRTAIVLEGMMIGLAGGLLAIPLVMLASLLFRHLPGIGEFLAFRLTPDVALIGILSSIALCALGALYPAIRTTRLSPSQALRTA